MRPPMTRSWSSMPRPDPTPPSAAQALCPKIIPARPAPMKPPMRPDMKGCRCMKLGAPRAGEGATEPGRVALGEDGDGAGVALRSMGFAELLSEVREPRLPWLDPLPARASASAGASAINSDSTSASDQRRRLVGRLPDEIVTVLLPGTVSRPLLYRYCGDFDRRGGGNCGGAEVAAPRHRTNGEGRRAAAHLDL